jgi:hypothetical protein
MPPVGDEGSAKKPTKYTGTISFPEFTSTTPLDELDVQVKHGKKAVPAKHKSAVDEAVGALKTQLQGKFGELIKAYAEK